MDLDIAFPSGRMLRENVGCSFSMLATRSISEHLTDRSQIPRMCTVHLHSSGSAIAVSLFRYFVPHTLTTLAEGYSLSDRSNSISYRTHVSKIFFTALYSPLSPETKRERESVTRRL